MYINHLWKNSLKTDILAVSGKESQVSGKTDEKETCTILIVNCVFLEIR